MEDIVAEIKLAESAAAEKKEEAKKKAARILADAEAEADNILKIAETDCAALRARIIAAATEQAEHDYAVAVAQNADKAREYADGLIGHAENYVVEIVGRITK